MILSIFDPAKAEKDGHTRDVRELTNRKSQKSSWSTDSVERLAGDRDAV